MLDGSLSLVVPAHNERDNIGPLLRAARSVLPTIAPRFDLLVVDDGSTDGTADAARAAMAGDSRLQIIRHDHKRGALVSVADGLRAARGDFVAYIDSDGQFRVEDLALLAACFDRADLVGGRRLHRADPWFRSVISGVFNVLVRLLYGLPYRDMDCGLKLMRREVLEQVSPLLGRSACLNAELYFKAHRCRFRIVQVPVPHYPRLSGRRSGGRLKPILRALRELIRLRLRLAREWHPVGSLETARP
ncbi:MAG TPA: glycosyltransferase family 2 protein [Candidatus Limnocylindrales bacterium]|nr:glycosyltransferase family 2 protein [Candidatus Limnocylindrales bacterium]